MKIIRGDIAFTTTNNSQNGGLEYRVQFIFIILVKFLLGLYGLNLVRKTFWFWLFLKVTSNTIWGRKKVTFYRGNFFNFGAAASCRKKA